MKVPHTTYGGAPEASWICVFYASELMTAVSRVISENGNRVC